MEYKASLDKLCKILTASVFIIVIGLFITLFTLRGHLMHHKKSLIAGVIVPAVMAGCYIYAPKSYALNDKELLINRLAKNKKIPLADIAEVRILSGADFRGTIRTFGNGGFFGYTGKYYNTQLGSMTWYVTQRKNRILIRTKSNRKIIISPDDISLADALQRMIVN